MMMFGRLLLAAALSFAALPAVAQTKPKVVATFSILGDLVAQVAGDRIDLAVLVGADTDAHTYQPKPSDARTLAAAQRLFERQDAQQKRRLLNFVVSNCVWKNGELTADFRQPFDMLAVASANLTSDESNGISPTPSGMPEISGANSST
jgi:hypothetical protein